MATAAEIKKVILDIAGNPTTGVVAEYADRWADAIQALDNPTKEVRVVEPKETR